MFLGLCQFAGTIRSPSSPHFDRNTQYILISYPMDTSPSLSSGKVGYHSRSVEALVQGWGWEGHEGDEPPASVVIMAGGKEIEGICFACLGNLMR